MSNQLTDQQPNQPLSGVTVLDFGQIYNGPYCGFLLGQAGARVIKVESPKGEAMRGRAETTAASYPFHMLNAGKEGITLNFKSAVGQELLKKLVLKADVLVENFAPGTLARYGVGAETLCAINPQLVYAAGTGFGSTGPHKDYLAMDNTVQAMSGVMSINGTGEHGPMKAGPAIADFFGGVHLYSAVVTALYNRSQTGCGSIADVSMQDSVLPSMATALGVYYYTGEVPTPAGNHHPARSAAPFNVYAAKDGHVAIICIREGHWRKVVKAMGRPELLDQSEFATMADRSANMELLDAEVESWTLAHTKKELFDIAQANGVICAPVQDVKDLVNDPHLAERGSLQTVNVPTLGDVKMPKTALRFKGVEPPKLLSSPALGQDNVAIYGELLGLDAQAVEQLQKDEAI